VGERAGRGRARGDRQQEGRADADGAAQLRQRRARCPTIARALGKLGDVRVIEPMVRLLERPEKEIKVEAINALARLADDKRADSVRSYIQAAGANSTDETIQHAAYARSRKSTTVTRAPPSRLQRPATAANVKAAKMAEPARTLLIEKGDVDQVLKKAEETAASAVKMDIATLKNGDIIEGRYKYIEKIGKGAFGTVVLVEDTVVDERLILKFLNPNVANDEEMMKRFVHELRYSRKITHKNVIRIYDFLYMRGNYAISMEYFPGHTLGSEIVNEKPLPLPRAIQYGIDIATGMTVAHQVGVVHRDLKPANIMINNEGLLKVLDFGVAAAQKEGDTQLTKTGYVIGSPKYMAPEQILGKKVDQRRRHLQRRRDHVRDVHRAAALQPRRPHVGHVPARAGQSESGDRREPGAAERTLRPGRPRRCRSTR
jgi:serine/threonine-protein kinase